MSAGVVVVGGGQAGVTAAAALRRGGHPGPVTVVGAEPGLPYERPPLSKAYLAGRAEADDLLLRPADSYAAEGVDLLAGDPVTAVDRAARAVRSASGRELPYDDLVLAVGARPRALAVPGGGSDPLDGVLALRTLPDADRLRARLADARAVVVVGGGVIGLEVAAVAAGLGRPVTVVEALHRTMARVVGPGLSAAVEAEHAARGTRLLLGTTVAALDGDATGRVRAVVTADGRELAADLVLVAVGVEPETGLAAAAGLAVADAAPGGIVVDEHLATPDPRVSAIGDCALFPSRHAGGARVRLESVQNAVDSARCVAARLAGSPAPYTAVPWFWSDQFDLRVQVAGLPDPADVTVVRGDPAAGAFSLLGFRGGRLAAVESLTSPADHLAARRLLAAAACDLTPEQAADPGFDLKGYARGLPRSAA